MSEDEIIAQREKVVNSHLAQLMEHFDTVHIFVSKFENGETWDGCSGDGNVLARQAQCRQWVLITDERLLKHIRSEPPK